MRSKMLRNLFVCLMVVVVGVGFSGCYDDFAYSVYESDYFKVMANLANFKVVMEDNWYNLDDQLMGTIKYEEIRDGDKVYISKTYFELGGSIKWSSKSVFLNNKMYLIESTALKKENYPEGPKPPTMSRWLGNKSAFCNRTNFYKGSYDQQDEIYLGREAVRYSRSNTLYKTSDTIRDKEFDVFLAYYNYREEGGLSRKEEVVLFEIGGQSLDYFLNYPIV